MNLKSERYEFTSNVAITPAIAKEMLETSPGNRKLSQAAVLAYAEAMRRGQWHQNGNVLKFDKEGRLRDGHHRLSAVILASRTVVMDVAIGIEESALYSIDCGRVRRLSDFLRMFGEGKNADLRAAYLNQSVQLMTGSIVPIRTIDEYEKWMVPFGVGVEWALRDLGGYRHMTNAPIAGALAFAHKTDPDGVALFAEQVCTGEKLSVGDPAHTLRRVILEGGSLRANHESRMAVCRRVLNGVVAALEGRRLNRVYDSQHGLLFFRKVYLRTSAAADLSRAWTLREGSAALLAEGGLQ